VSWTQTRPRSRSGGPAQTLGTPKTMMKLSGRSRGMHDENNVRQNSSDQPGHFERMHEHIVEYMPKLRGCSGCAERAKILDELVQKAKGLTGGGKVQEEHVAGDNKATEAKAGSSPLSAVLQVFGKKQRQGSKAGRGSREKDPRRKGSRMSRVSVSANRRVPDGTLRVRPVLDARTEDKAE